MEKWKKKNQYVLAKTALSRAMIIIMQVNVFYTGYIYDNVPVLYCHDAMILSPK